MTQRKQPDQEPSQKKKYDDGDPYKVYRERWVRIHPPEKVAELIRHMEGDQSEYGNFGKKVVVNNDIPSRLEFLYGRYPVGERDVEHKIGVTICANCVHCVQDPVRSGSDSFAFAKCEKTVEHIPDTVNVITGEKISKIPKMDYCANKNHGECPDWEEKRLNDNETISWEDVKKNRQPNPWLSMWNRIKSYIPQIKFE